MGHPHLSAVVRCNTFYVGSHKGPSEDVGGLPELGWVTEGAHSLITKLRNSMSTDLMALIGQFLEKGLIATCNFVVESLVEGLNKLWGVLLLLLLHETPFGKSPFQSTPSDMSSSAFLQCMVEEIESFFLYTVDVINEDLIIVQWDFLWRHDAAQRLIERTGERWKGGEQGNGRWSSTSAGLRLHCGSAGRGLAMMPAQREVPNNFRNDAWKRTNICRKMGKWLPISLAGQSDVI
jgi:hypothetical protein